MQQPDGCHAWWSLMPVTKEQAQMLAILAVACRPYRAPTWDPAGVLANIGRVADRSLVEVALAVIRAAADPDAKTPGVIPTAGRHWSEQLKPEPWRPDTVSAADRCGICGKERTRCQTTRVADDDHAFEPDRYAPPSPEVAARTIAALREEIRSRPGAAERIDADVDRMNQVLTDEETQ